MNKRKQDLIYVGIDLHKESHTAVILDCWNTKLGEITFANTPAEFPKLIRKASKFCEFLNYHNPLRLTFIIIIPSVVNFLCNQSE